MIDLVLKNDWTIRAGVTIYAGSKLTVDPVFYHQLLKADMIEFKEEEEQKQEN